MKYIILFIYFILPAVQAQDFLNLLTPEAPLTTIEFEGIFLPESEVEKGKDKTGITHQMITINQKIFRNDERMIMLGGRYQKLDLFGDTKYLHDYYNQQGSLTYKENLSGDKFALLNVTFGSASNRPFQSKRDNTQGANMIYKFNSKWFGVLNYSNNRTFFNNKPLPGFFYIGEMTRENILVIGFPFILWQKPVADHLSIKYFGLIPWSHRLKLLYTKHIWIKPYVGFEQVPQTYFRHEREERYDRFFWFERRLMTGLEGGFSRKLRYDFAAGLAFDRQFFEARNFSQDKEFLINLDKSFFAALNLRFIL
jgi:hypothetical protein